MCLPRVCFHIPTARMYISRDVVFHEQSFPFSSPSSPSIPNLQASSTLLPSTLALPSYPVSSPPAAISRPSSPPLSPTTSSVSSGSLESPVVPHSPSPCPAPTRLHPMVTRAQNQIVQPRIFTDGRVKYPISRALLAVHDVALTEPTCYSNVVKVPEWRQAMQTEFNALLQNQTWTLVPQQATNLVGCKWVFKVKRKVDGSIKRHKARLVAKGFHQQAGLDYGETFSSVVKPTTIRTVLTVAYSRGWDMLQIDIQNTFLHGYLDEEVYMTQPPGFSHPSLPNHVCKLQKALYGLKQAPRAWFVRLSNRLHELGFTNSKADSSFFILRTSSLIMFVLVYVVDIIITASVPAAISDLLQQLQMSFAVKDLGKLNYFLGVEVTPLKTGLLLSQRRYIIDLLKRTNMLEAKPISSPMSSSSSLSAFDGDSMEDPILYRSTVGSLQYLSLTRPDLAFAVKRECQFMHKPSKLHWQAVKRILRYLKHTVSHGLLLTRLNISILEAFSDADWAGCPDDRKSTGGYCVFLGSNLISWSSKKHPTVSRSSTEAEYKSVANATAELLWIQYLLRDLGVPLSSPPKLWCDNIGATYLAANPVFHARTKHVEIDFHFVRGQVAAKTLQILFTPSKEQIADILTKPIVSNWFQWLCSKLNVHPDPLTLRGDVKAQGLLSKSPSVEGLLASTEDKSFR